MNTPTPPLASQSNKTAHQPAATDSHCPLPDSDSYTVTVNRNGSITPSTISADGGDTYTVENTSGYPYAAVIWDNRNAIGIVNAGASSGALPCVASHTYVITIMTTSTPSFVNSKINVGSGPKDPE